MAFFRVELKSTSLGMYTSCCIVIPDEITFSEIRMAPVVFLLHGLSDNCTGWSRYTSAERYARTKKVCLVMPEAQKSFYTDMDRGMKYFTYVSSELVHWCEGMLGLNGHKYVMGLSMGGYGALKCYLSCRDTFLGCGAFSSVIDPDYIKIHEGPDLKGIFNQDKPVPDDCDLFCLLRSQHEKCRIFLSCGTEDPLCTCNRKFASKLMEAGHETRIVFQPGSHSWEFWDQSLKEALDYFFPEKSE